MISVLAWQRRKESCLQDSSPAAVALSDIKTDGNRFCRSAIRSLLLIREQYLISSLWISESYRKILVLLNRKSGQFLNIFVGKADKSSKNLLHKRTESDILLVKKVFSEVFYDIQRHGSTNRRFFLPQSQRSSPDYRCPSGR